MGQIGKGKLMSANIPIRPDVPAKKSHTIRNLILGGVAVLIIASALATQDATTPTDAPSDQAPEVVGSGFTVSQENAIESAQNYLSTAPFSESGLIEQLEFEGYSKDDASFAVSHIQVDWNEQAARSAANYLDSMPFSRSGLIEQLEFEGFTHSQAVYGVNQTGL